MLLAAYRYGGYGFYFDPTYFLVVIGLLLSLWASSVVNSTFNKYSKVRCMSNLSGAEAARKVLDSCGLYNVSIEHISGKLTDHYDPRSKVLRLSDSTYASRSVAAVCVAAHECGHAIQDQKQYGPLVLRSTLVPLANFGSTAAWPVFIAGPYHVPSPAGDGRHRAFHPGCPFPAGDASRGVQRFRESHQSAGEHRHAGFHRDRRGEKSAAGSSHDLCGKPGSFCFTAFKTDYSGRRKKRP